MLHRTDRHKSRGFTLMELAIVLGVVGSVLGAIWWAAGNAQELARQNSAVTELQTVSQNMINLYAGRTLGTCKTFGTNFTSCAIDAQVIPSTYVNVTTGTTVDNPWSLGNFKITENPSGANNRQFRLTFNQVSRQGCMALLMSATACQFGQSGCPINAMTNNGATADQIAPATIAAGWPATMTSTEADTLCSANSYTGVGNNSVEFDYTL